MKTYTIPSYIIILLAFVLVSFGDPYTIKRISDKDFRYEFYTTDKKLTPKKNKTYYWFKGGLVHEAQGGIAGDLLNDKFTKMYHSNQLAEQGQFKNGLRVGLWKSWHQNGVLATTLSYSNGLRSGKYFRYDESGNLVENGKFSSDLKTGKWINAQTKETITYRKGEIVKEKQTFTKSEKYKNKQDAAKLENAEKNKKESAEASDAEKLASYKTREKEEKALEKEKATRDREIKSTAKKTAKEAKKQSREQAKNEPKKDSKVKTFFNNLFKKKDKAPQ